jgi:5-hydroxyisourate hydrolase
LTARSPGPDRATVSTHVIDAGHGGGRPGVRVELLDHQDRLVAAGTTDADGRIADLTAGVGPGTYRLRWLLGGAFISEATATLRLTSGRHYHLPLVASDYCASVYLGV